MNELQDALQHRLERRSLELFNDSVDGLDMPMRSRLNQARHAALADVAGSGRRPRVFRPAWWAPAGGVAAAALLGLTLWFVTPAGELLTHRGSTASDNQPGLEDLDIVAATDGSGDALDMLQDDLDFYDFADGAAGTGPAV